MILIYTMKDGMISHMLILPPVYRIELLAEKLLITISESLAIPRIRINKCSVDIKYDQNFAQVGQVVKLAWLLADADHLCNP